jgi:hypothetical protein
MSSAGIAAPPDMQVRSDEQSASSAPSEWSIALYIVGTPWKIVTWSRPKISSALSGSKRGSMVTVAPMQTAAFIVQVCPKEWNSGSAPSSTSSALSSPRFADTPAQFLYRFACVSSAPFGLPVVPEV